eukprot:Rhum_TRINITY_DN14693_c0_g1::Rhum_TRINITY_DN14693_c0_g1_i2::g.107857::m.107857
MVCFCWVGGGGQTLGSTAVRKPEWRGEGATTAGGATLLLSRRRRVGEGVDPGPEGSRKTQLAVGHRQVLARLHLVQTADSPSEGEDLLSPGEQRRALQIRHPEGVAEFRGLVRPRLASHARLAAEDVVGLRGRRADDFAAALVHLVDKVDKPTGLRALVEGHLRDVCDADGVVVVADCAEVGRRHGLVAEVAEREDGDAGVRPRHGHVAPEHAHGRRRHLVALRQHADDFVEARLRRGVVRGVVDGVGEGRVLAAVVGLGLHGVRVCVLAEGRDEREELVPVEPALVQVRGRPVRRRDHAEPVLVQPLEQAHHDHGIADVRHLELVEAQQLDLVADVAGHTVERTSGAALLLRGRHALVHV